MLIIILSIAPAYAEEIPIDDGAAISFSAGATISDDAVVVSYMKLPDETGIAHSEMKADGSVKGYIKNRSKAAFSMPPVIFLKLTESAIRTHAKKLNVAVF